MRRGAAIHYCQTSSRVQLYAAQLVSILYHITKYSSDSPEPSPSIIPILSQAKDPLVMIFADKSPNFTSTFCVCAVKSSRNFVDSSNPHRNYRNGAHMSAGRVCGASAQNQAATHRRNCHNIAMFIFDKWKSKIKQNGYYSSFHFFY